MSANEIGFILYRQGTINRRCNYVIINKQYNNKYNLNILLKKDNKYFLNLFNINIKQLVNFYHDEELIA